MAKFELIPSVRNIDARINLMRHFLIEARTDFDRVKVRDEGAALKQAATILGRQDVVVEASLLVADAERAISKANPPRRRGEIVPAGNVLSPAAIRKIRMAHGKMSDEQYEGLKAEARDRNR